MAIAMQMEPFIVKEFVVAKHFGHWILLALANGGFQAPVNGNEGLIQFDHEQSARQQCDKMNQELKIERGN